MPSPRAIAPIIAASWVSSSARRTVKSRRTSGTTTAVSSLVPLVTLLSKTLGQALKTGASTNCHEQITWANLGLRLRDERHRFRPALECDYPDTITIMLQRRNCSSGDTATFGNPHFFQTEFLRPQPRQ